MSKSDHWEILMKTLLRYCLAALLTAPALWAGSRAFLGIVPTDTADLSLRGYEGQGILIAKTVEGGPAQRAGIESGDILTALGGKPLMDSDDLSFFLRRLSPGEDVRVSYWRSGEVETVTVTMAEYPEEQVIEARIMKSTPSLSGKAFLGVDVQSVNENLLRYFGVEEGVGVLVDAVVAGSPADGVGLRVGDVIVEIDGHQVDSPGRLRNLIRRNKPGTEIELLLVRKQERLRLTVRLADRDFSELEIPRIDLELDLPALPIPWVEPDEAEDRKTRWLPGLRALSGIFDLLKRLGGSPAIVDRIQPATGEQVRAARSAG